MTLVLPVRPITVSSSVAMATYSSSGDQVIAYAPRT
jgi:hypothetical protein